MDFRSMLDQVKSAFVIGKGNSFLHGGQPERQQTQDYYEPQQASAPEQSYAAGYQAPYQQQAAPYQGDPMFQSPQQGMYQQPQQSPWQQPQQSAYQQSAPQQAPYQAQQQNIYQQPQQGFYQQPQQPVYQQSAPQQQNAWQQPQRQPSFQTQIDPFGQERNRRGGRHREQQSEAPAWNQPQAENLVQFPGSAQAQQQSGAPAAIDAYVINVFNLNSCRQAMSCLRRGQCTLIVMDQLFDKAEIRRYVDMLTGACYALNGTMTRLSSKIGFYIMAPAGMTVYTDPTTSNANSARPAAQAAGFGAADAGSARTGLDFSAQTYGAAPQMSFAAHQTETRQAAPEQSYRPGAYAAPSQESYREPVYAQQENYQNAYQEEAAQRYAQ